VSPPSVAAALTAVASSPKLSPGSAPKPPVDDRSPGKLGSAAKPAAPPDPTAVHLVPAPATPAPAAPALTTPAPATPVYTSAPATPVYTPPPAMCRAQCADAARACKASCKATYRGYHDQHPCKASCDQVERDCRSRAPC
jgi:hypothetical protein